MLRWPDRVVSPWVVQRAKRRRRRARRTTCWRRQPSIHSWSPWGVGVRQPVPRPRGLRGLGRGAWRS